MIGFYPWLSLLLSSFNAITFTLLLSLWLREYWRERTHWGGIVYACVAAALAIVFGCNVFNYLFLGLTYRPLLAVRYPQITANALVSPLVFHFFYRNEREHLRAYAAWRVGLAVIYATGIVFALLAFAAPPAIDFLAQAAPLTAYRLLMAGGAAGTGSVLLASQRARTDRLFRNQRRILVLLCAAWLLTYLAGPKGGWGELLALSLPLCFGFVITYYVERPAFFDVLVKKGAFTFCSLVLLVLYLRFIAPLFLRLWWQGGTAVLAWALLVLPVVLIAPWGQRRISAWLDRVCLGRRFPPAEASKYFLAGLQEAISEGELAGHAERLLGDVFQSGARVLADGARAASGECLRADVLLHGTRVGAIWVQPRRHGPRFLSEDVALLSSLAETYSFVLENLRLREERARRDRREQDLLLEASRSELKALRAQVNPHFMFNALNTIAGLIPRRPDRAERTIEQLAEVFRYTLRRSEREWVPVSEELEAVRAYLEIERTRFGDRLEIEIHADDEAAQARIPAMVVQTLVENAVKHGAGAVRTPGRIEVRVDLAEQRLRVEVRDNGPGFEDTAIRASHSPGNGHGLHNIRERLRGYFGDAARLGIGRDEAAGMTVVSVEMPRTVAAAETAP